MSETDQTPEEADAADLASAHQEAADDSDRPGIGRPKIGGSALIRFGDLLSRIDERAGKQHLSRAELVRRAVQAYLDPVEPSIEAVQKHLRAGYTAILHVTGTGTPKVDLYRTREEAHEMLERLPELLTSDGYHEVVARSDIHLVLRTTVGSGQLSWYTIVDDAPVTRAPAITLGEAEMCRRLGLDPVDLWPDSSSRPRGRSPEVVSGQ